MKCICMANAFFKRCWFESLTWEIFGAPLCLYVPLVLSGVIQGRDWEGPIAMMELNLLVELNLRFKAPAII